MSKNNNKKNPTANIKKAIIQHDATGSMVDNNNKKNVERAAKMINQKSEKNIEEAFKILSEACNKDS